MGQDTSSELTRGVFFFLQFDRDPNFTHAPDGSDEYIPLSRLVTTIHAIGDEQSDFIPPLAAKLAITRIYDDKGDRERTLEQALDGHLPDLRIQRKDIATAVSAVAKITDTKTIKIATNRLLKAFNLVQPK